jgi:hypothetical protein
MGLAAGKLITVGVVPQFVEIVKVPESVLAFGAITVPVRLYKPLAQALVFTVKPLQLDVPAPGRPEFV